MKLKASSYHRGLVVTRKRTHTPLVSGDLLTSQSANAVRSAYKAGKHKVTIRDVEFTITRKGDDHLLIKPVLGRLPMAQIQIVNGPTKKLQKWSEEPATRKPPKRY